MSSEESSEYESTSSESSQEVLKPVFVKKGKKAELDTKEVVKDQAKTIISKLESKGTKSPDVSEKNDFDGVDDTDDLDPEQEFEQWKERERLRFLRDRQLLQTEETAKEDRLRGVKRRAEELENTSS
ncbi:uncharacterized protein CANTADRAFT_262663 [Suhomyces tanzawaensis NRRL Y-17324]|uniref:Micro-fibrillar-associated protein 1 C-terminal domain-containing protein n=1 Tax=Suhomyces tanzawaensis NRRL Y-17324 TaxID=984487 RepID=A0A1E4SFI6_9ASCO|nr:uncharacterized protein CANTADRAFT_262663 [Suhomyces tanzawaensis NRRL Y-17324]ODV78271.1 hypothetical protein CANTADRAFT_262663 [Suhomyces tanzawaensis NRRL Y-17324]